MDTFDEFTNTLSYQGSKTTYKTIASCKAGCLANNDCMAYDYVMSSNDCWFHKGGYISLVNPNAAGVNQYRRVICESTAVPTTTARIVSTGAVGKLFIVFGNHCYTNHRTPLHVLLLPLHIVRCYCIEKQLSFKLLLLILPQPLYIRITNHSQTNHHTHIASTTPSHCHKPLSDQPLHSYCLNHSIS